MDEECQICYIASKKLYQCTDSKCQAKFCMNCISNPEWAKPHCLSCDQYIGRYDLVQFMGLPKYVSTFSKHYTEIYRNREEKMLPVAQRYIEWKAYQDLKQKNKRFLNQATNRGFVLKPELEIPFELIAENISSGKNYYRCEQGDCAGIVMFGKCGICNKSYCETCNQRIKSDNHKCDPTIIESIKEMKQSTKPCPSCYRPIVKSEGCNHMRCTNCGIRFDWSTMMVQISNTNPIKDNELLTKSNSNLVLPEDIDKENIENILWKVDPNIISMMMKTKFNSVKIIEKFHSDLMNLRIDFLKGKFDKDKWLNKILSLETDYDYKSQIIFALSKYLDSINDTEKDYEKRFELIQNINIQLIKIGIAYGQKQFTLKLDANNSHPIIGL